MQLRMDRMIKQGSKADHKLLIIFRSSGVINYIQFDKYEKFTQGEIKTSTTF